MDEVSIFESFSPHIGYSVVKHVIHTVDLTWETVESQN